MVKSVIFERHADRRLTNSHWQRRCTSCKATKKPIDMTGQDCTECQKGNDLKPISVTMEVENRELVMELDTGSAVSVIEEEKYYEQLRHVPLESTNLYSKFVMEIKASIFSCM